MYDGGDELHETDESVAVGTSASGVPPLRLAGAEEDQDEATIVRGID